jgi:hypothetical protein
MTHFGYKPLLALMWVAFVTTALNYWSAWDQLPARVAVHFDQNWQPNGFASKEGSVEIGLGIMAVLLVLFTVTGLMAHAMKPAAAWPMLIVFYVVIGFVWYGNYSIVKFNLHAQPAHSALSLKQSAQLSALSQSSIEQLRTEN